MKNLGLTIWIVVGTACAIVLFQIKEEVNALEGQLAQVESQIERDKEAIRIIETMNEDDGVWIAGEQRGKPIKVQYNAPIRFTGR